MLKIDFQSVEDAVALAARIDGRDIQIDGDINPYDDLTFTIAGSNEPFSVNEFAKDSPLRTALDSVSKAVEDATAVAVVMVGERGSDGYNASTIFAGVPTMDLITRTIRSHHGPRSWVESRDAFLLALEESKDKVIAELNLIRSGDVSGFGMNVGDKWLAIEIDHVIPVTE